ncbi:hypothetical protein VTO73DRAFT_5841 [Trametes versicolor]
MPSGGRPREWEPCILGAAARTSEVAAVPPYRVRTVPDGQVCMNAGVGWGQLLSGREIRSTTLRWHKEPHEDATEGFLGVILGTLPP